jgi:hypothetical protein
MDSQPILIEFDSLFPNELYFPMMDVHGNEEPQLKVGRNHILAVGAEVIAEPLISSKELPNFPWQNLQFDGIVLERMSDNGDFWATPKENNRFSSKFTNLYHGN